MSIDFAKLLETGEIAREQEQYTKALNIFNELIVTAGLAKKHIYVFDALIHRSHLYKHLYQKTNDAVFLLLMSNDAQTSYQIAKTKLKNKLDVAFMDLGNFHYLKEDFEQSSKYYNLAIKHLNNKPKAPYAEFLSHLGISQVLAGRKQGLVLLKKAGALIAQDQSLRPFHKLVVESGNDMRVLLATHKLRTEHNTKLLKTKIASQVNLLAKKYGMPMRQIQYRQLLKTIGSN